MNNHKRKLAAIVFTDIVGFTKLTAENQSGASILLTEQRNLLRPIVDSHSGSWLKEMGDGLLLIFDTVTDAVNCTIKIQEAAMKIEHLILRIGY
jgi:class 3 adenylate cyclase